MTHCYGSGGYGLRPNRPYALPGAENRRTPHRRAGAENHQQTENQAGEKIPGAPSKSYGKADGKKFDGKRGGKKPFAERKGGGNYQRKGDRA